MSRAFLPLLCTQVVPEHHWEPTSAGHRGRESAVKLSYLHTTTDSARNVLKACLAALLTPGTQPITDGSRGTRYPLFGQLRLCKCKRSCNAEGHVPPDPRSRPRSSPFKDFLTEPGTSCKTVASRSHISRLMKSTSSDRDGNLSTHAWTGRADRDDSPTPDYQTVVPCCCHVGSQSKGGAQEPSLQG